VAGLYYSATSGQAAEIHLSGSTLLTPWPLSIFAFVRRPVIAAALFHEIGHHVQHLRHGGADIDQEADADSYADRWMKRLYPFHLGVFGFLVVSSVLLAGPFRRLWRVVRGRRDGGTSGKK
jgi:hypothetical protein